MLPQDFTSSANGAAHVATFATVADGAVADYSRGVGTQVGVVPMDANRSDPDLTGHFVREITTCAARP